MELMAVARLAEPVCGLEAAIEVFAVAGDQLHIVRAEPTAEGLADGLREVARLIEAPRMPG